MMHKRKTAYSLASFGVCALIVLLLYYSDVSADAVRDALCFSVQTVVPALFAFSVLSSFLSSVGLPRFVTKALPLHRLLGLPECAAPAVACGLIGGFPVGAMLACSLYDSGRVTRSEAARLCAVSSNVGCAYLVGAVGGMFGSRAFGVILWAAQSLTGVACGALMRGCGEKSRTKTVNENTVRVSAAFCDAVAKSSLACVTVSGYIVFFRVISAIIAEIIPASLGPLSLLLEFSSGTAYAAGIGSAAACGLAVGFGGVSALMQVYNCTSKSGVPMMPTLIVKCVAAAVLSAVGWAARGLINPLAAESVFSSVGQPWKTCAAIAIAGIVAAFVCKKYFSRGY